MIECARWWWTVCRRYNCLMNGRWHRLSNTMLHCWSQITQLYTNEETEMKIMRNHIFDSLACLWYHNLTELTVCGILYDSGVAGSSVALFVWRSTGDIASIRIVWIFTSLRFPFTRLQMEKKRRTGRLVRRKYDVDQLQVEAFVHIVLSCWSVSKYF